MGAAMATVCALDLRYNVHPQPDVRVYTFGSPRVGNDIFATFYKTAIQARHPLSFASPYTWCARVSFAAVVRTDTSCRVD